VQVAKKGLATVRETTGPRDFSTDRPTLSIMEKVNLAEKFARITEHWRPKVVGDLNAQEVKLVKFEGAFVWHHHEREDEASSIGRWRSRKPRRWCSSPRPRATRGTFGIRP
jgi:hypothetical protein